MPVTQSKPIHQYHAIHRSSAHELAGAAPTHKDAKATLILLRGDIFSNLFLQNPFSYFISYSYQKVRGTISVTLAWVVVTEKNKQIRSARVAYKGSHL